jgi:hypothetical protein
MASKVITQMRQVAAAEQVGERLAGLEKVAEQINERLGRIEKALGLKLAPAQPEVPAQPETTPTDGPGEVVTDEPKRRSAQPHRTPGK